MSVWWCQSALTSETDPAVPKNEYLRTVPSTHSVDGLKHLSGLTTIYNQLNNFNGKGIAAHLFIESKFNELISLFLQSYQQNRQTEEVSSGHRIKTEDLPHISAVKEHLAAHLEGPINMAFLSRMACMSQSKLKYCFREATGFSIAGWRQRFRMQTARELLLTTNLSGQRHRGPCRIPESRKLF